MGALKQTRPGNSARLAISMLAVIIADDEVVYIKQPSSINFLTLVTTLAAS